MEKILCDRKCQIAFYRKEENKSKREMRPNYSQVDVECEWCDETFKTYYSTRNKVRFCSMKCRANWQSDMMKGEKHHNWRGGATKERNLDMSGREYKNWRESVFKRDGYTCQLCGDCSGGNLNAHRIKEYSNFPELRHVVSNGVTYCKKCHERTHNS